MKPKVILTRKLPDSVETRMRELFDAELSADDVSCRLKHYPADAASRCSGAHCNRQDRC